MTYLDDVIRVVDQHEAASPRSRQSAVGWSELGGCQAALWFRTRDIWPTDTPDVARAATGTALHAWWTALMSARYPARRYDVPTTYRGIPGHADEVDPAEPSVTDLKTITLRKADRLQKVRHHLRRDHTEWRPKLIQVNGYAAGLVDAGELPEQGLIVRLLFVPVDGKFRDWWVHEQPFDRALADEGADNHDRVSAEPVVPPCDHDVAFCAGWCPFYAIRPTGGVRA